MILHHNLGQSVSLQPASDAPALWTYVYSGRPKPYFHPVRTPAGHVLSLFEPHDHVWHRGLWFTIKFINGENFWEEDLQTGQHGTQVTLRPPTVSADADGPITIASEQEWLRPSNAGTVFHEKRTFIHRPIADDAYALDFDFDLTAQADLLLDRTPFTTWGGYGGLILRGNRNWQETRLLFSDGTTSERPKGHPANWCDLSGKIDGGPKLTGGVAMFDHPDNVRHPTPWYGAIGAGHYFNAAFLFHEPMNVAKGQRLRFRYRVLVHDTMFDQQRLEREYQSYLKSAKA